MKRKVIRKASEPKGLIGKYIHVFDHSGLIMAGGKVTEAVGDFRVTVQWHTLSRCEPTTELGLVALDTLTDKLGTNRHKVTIYTSKKAWEEAGPRLYRKRSTALLLRKNSYTDKANTGEWERVYG